VRLLGQGRTGKIDVEGYWSQGKAVECQNLILWSFLEVVEELENEGVAKVVGERDKRMS